MNLKTLSTDIHPEFFEIAELINTAGFKVGIIGGWVRDYMLKQGISTDYDLELRQIDSSKDLLTEYNNLKTLLASEYRVRELPFNITTISMGSLSFELNLPRVETYSGDFHHSNIKVDFIPDSDYTTGFFRRDFTINAMMLEYSEKSFTFIDPLGGKQDIENKILKPCGDSFSKDPVRFLRALRFSLKYDFEIEQQIIEDFKQLSIKSFSSHYLQYEGFKSTKLFSFISRLNEFLGKPNLINLTPELKGYENEFKANSLKSFLASCYILPTAIAETLKENFKVKTPTFSIPKVKFKDIAVFSKDQVELLLTVYNKLMNDHHEIIDFYFKYEYIDISHADFKRISELKVASNHIEKKDRNTFIFFEKLKRLYGN